MEPRWGEPTAPVANLNALAARYQELIQYLDWSEADQTRMQTLAPLVEPELPRFVDGFYAAVVQHASTRKVLTGGQAQVDRLKNSLTLWLREFLTAPINLEYVQVRTRAGQRHVLIGLDQIFASAALSRLRQELLLCVQQRWHAGLPPLSDLLATLNRRLDLDLVIIEDAYQQELRARAAPVDDARLHQQAAIARLGEKALFRGTIDDLMDHALLQVAGPMAAPRVCLWQLDKETDHFELRAAVGLPLEQVGRLRLQNRDGGFLSKTLQQDQPVVVNDARLTEGFELTSEPDWEGMLSGVGVALPGAEDPISVMVVYSPELREFKRQDLDFVYSVAQLLAMARQRYQAEQTLRDREARWAKMVENLPAGAAHVRGSALTINRELERITGYSRDELCSVADWQAKLQGPSPEVVRQKLGTGPVAEGEATFPLLRKDGARRLLEFSAYSEDEEDVWLIRDVTDFLEAKERFVRSERLAAIGQMLTGLAHESRNALQRIQAVTELLEFEVEQTPQTKELLGRSQQAQAELRRLFDEVRDYARPFKLERTPCQLSSVWREAWELLAPQRAGRTAILHEKLLCGKQELLLDRYRMVQLFRNLFENALSACPAACLVDIQCRFQDPTQTRVEVQVSDNGPGLTEEVRRRIFEPFFTTKSKGTGLGMAIAERIVDAHGGKIEATNRASGGALFTISLPLTPA